MTFQPGDHALLDNVVKVRVVRVLPDGSSIIIQVGADTQVVDVTTLSTTE